MLPATILYISWLFAVHPFLLVCKPVFSAVRLTAILLVLGSGKVEMQIGWDAEGAGALGASATQGICMDTVLTRMASSCSFARAASA